MHAWKLPTPGTNSPSAASAATTIRGEHDLGAHLLEGTDRRPHVAAAIVEHHDPRHHSSSSSARCRASSPTWASNLMTPRSEGSTTKPCPRVRRRWRWDCPDEGTAQVAAGQATDEQATAGQLSTAMRSASTVSEPAARVTPPPPRLAGRGAPRPPRDRRSARSRGQVANRTRRPVATPATRPGAPPRGVTVTTARRPRPRTPGRVAAGAERAAGEQRHGIVVRRPDSAGGSVGRGRSTRERDDVAGTSPVRTQPSTRWGRRAAATAPGGTRVGGG